jgi:hypothetical protein
MPLLPSARLDGVRPPDRDGEGGHPESEKDAKLAQKLYQLQSFIVVFPQEAMGQFASFGPTCVFWANLPPCSLQVLDTLSSLTWTDYITVIAFASNTKQSQTAAATDATKVRKTPIWPRSWANFSLLYLCSHGNAWANLRLLGQLNTFLA